VPDIFERASRFRPGFVGPWPYWLLLGAVVTVVPFTLVRALRAGERMPGPASAGSPPPEERAVRPAEPTASATSAGPDS
jgi:hypothetical protein